MFGRFLEDFRRILEGFLDDFSILFWPPTKMADMRFDCAHASRNACRHFKNRSKIDKNSMQIVNRKIKAQKRLKKWIWEGLGLHLGGVWDGLGRLLGALGRLLAVFGVF